MDNSLQVWSNVLLGSFQNIGTRVLEFLPDLILSIIIFIAGWVIGALLGRIVAQIVRSLKVDNALKNIGAEELLARAGFNLDSGAFLGALIKIFTIFVFLIAALEVLGLSQVNVLLDSLIAGFLPDLIIVVILLFVAAVVADVLKKLVVGSAKASGVPYAHFLGELTSWIVWIFAVLLSLSQLNIGVGVLNTLFLGVVSALALAFGLSFGLGGQETASYYLEKIRKNIERH